MCVNILKHFLDFLVFLLLITGLIHIEFRHLLVTNFHQNLFRFLCFDDGNWSLLVDSFFLSIIVQHFCGVYHLRGREDSLLVEGILHELLLKHEVLKLLSLLPLTVKVLSSVHQA